MSDKSAAATYSSGSSSPQLVQTVAQTRVVAVWKVVEYAGLAAFILIVPRTMGPALYGRFASIVSLVTLLMSASGMGALATFGRFLPEYTAADDRPRGRALFVEIFWTRAVMASVLALIFLALLPVFLPGVSTPSSLLAAIALLTGAAAATSFQAFYGSKQLGKWSCQDALTRLLLLTLLIVLGGTASLDRALLALLLTNAVFLALGLTWSADFFRGERSAIRRADVLYHLKFGLTVFAGNFLLMMVWRLGESVTLALSGLSEEAAFFSIANNVVMTASLLELQFFVMLLPFFTARHVSGERAALTGEMGQVLRYVLLGSVLGVLGIHGAGAPLIAWLLGPGYEPVTANLRLLVLGLPPIALIGMGLTRSLIDRRPERSMLVNGTALAAFLGLSITLTGTMASVGTTIAVTAAMFAGACASVWFCRLAPVLRAAMFGRVAVLGLLSLAISVFSPTPPLLSAMLAAAALFVLAYATGVVRSEEIRQIILGLRSRKGTPGPGASAEDGFAGD